MQGTQSFDSLDTNSDGYLSREELNRDRNMSNDFSTMDKDNDGRISRSEFDNYQQHQSGGHGKR